jgi:hypothetical protein
MMAWLDIRRGRTSPSGGVGEGSVTAGWGRTTKGELSPLVSSRSRKRVSGARAAVAALAIALVTVAPAGGAPPVPVPTTPGDGNSFAFLPAFGWSAVSGADRFEFEIAADPGFNAPVLGSTYDHFFTKNTRATLTKVVPNGTYWWHVRGVATDGSVSGWSPAQSFTRNWASAPSLAAPADGATITFPAQPFRLSWTPVPGAAKYSVSVATDPSLASIVWANGQPVVTQATSFTLSSPLAPSQTYYWGITPLDAGGNPGSPSQVWSFTWVWPSGTTPSVTDVASAAEIQDFEFSWTPVAGAAGYELEVNSSVDWAAGSKVCCTVDSNTHLTTIGSTYSPTVVLRNNNAYYWRVRAVDASGNAGVWNVGPQFSKGFDNVVPSVKNLRMLDNPFPSEGSFETSTPIVKWDPVPGASAYEVEVTRYTPAGCDWNPPTNTEHWRSKTATPAWTPLGWAWGGGEPWPNDSYSPSSDLPGLVSGHSYCVRVFALDRPSDGGAYVQSVATSLPAAGTPAFTYPGPPTGGACSPSCNGGALGSGDYVGPIIGSTQQAMPYFRWKPLAGYASYFVLVSRDPEFSNLVDYAFTRVNAYAPRTGFGTRTYPDETNLYYWAVLPATEPNGSGVTTEPQLSAPSNFHKQSVPPSLLSPAEGAVFSGPARFRWTPTEGSRRYRLQVATDPSFSNLEEDLVFGTDSTTYTSSVTYLADTVLYWRVRAEDENGIGLTWSSVGTFRKTLAALVPDASNPTSGDALPSWSWAPVPGAVSYDFKLIAPNGFATSFNDIPSNVATPTLLKGTGIWKWQARANFPQVNTFQRTDGPWSPLVSFTRTIREPASPGEQVGQRLLLLHWEPKVGALNYRVQISSRQDFSLLLLDAPTTTDNPSYAPWLSAFTYAAGGTFYWRVAAADEVSANVGDFTTTRSFTLPGFGSSTKASSTTSALVRKTSTRIRVTGYVFPRHPGKVVSVTLYKKRSGVYVKLRTKRPTLSASSAYSTSFARPSAGYCKTRSLFAGDADHLASAKTVKFRC